MSDRPRDRAVRKDPDHWASGDDPMTEAQASYLETLSRETGEQVPDDMTKAEASEKIDELRKRAGLQDDDTPDRA